MSQSSLRANSKIRLCPLFCDPCFDVDAIETREHTPPACVPRGSWWMSLEDEDEEDAEDHET